MKKGKELKNNEFRNYNVTYGSVNNKNNKAVYINISTWAEPDYDDEINYHRVIRDIDKSIRQTIFHKLDKDITPFLNNRTIVDFDIRESGIRSSKKSFTNCEITLYTKNEIPINSEDIKPFLDDLTECVIDKCFEKNKYFKFNKRKK